MSEDAERVGRSQATHPPARLSAAPPPSQEAALPPSGTEERTWLDLALVLCDRADEISRRHFRRDLQVQTKADRTFVTQADREIEQMMRDQIRAAFPGHGLIGEEYGEETNESRFRWYIDPIDGTNNFLRGIPIFATLIALECEGAAVVGAVSAPALGSRWYAWLGGGSWVVEQPTVSATPAVRRLHVSRVARMEDAQLLYSSPGEVADSGLLPGFRATLRRAWRERGLGDFWGYVLVAEGAAEAMIELGVQSWDLGPMLLLLEEAGGTLTDFEGNRTIHGRSAVASNALLRDELMRSLHGPDVSAP